jgi:polysaccharide pyruvyl transferase WcaK-like protein
VPNANGDPVIYLVGTSGHPNLGDEFVVSAWLRHLARTQPNAEVWVDSPRPGPSAGLHGDLHPNVRFVDTLFRVAWDAPSEKPVDVVSFAVDAINSPAVMPRDAVALDDFKNVDIIHILGGSYLCANWPRHLSLLASALAISDRFGARTAITGTTMVPYDDDSIESLHELLARFDIVDVRDSATKDLLAPVVPQLTMTGDDAFLHPKLTERNPAAAAPTLVCVQTDFLTVSLEDVAEYIVRTLTEWGSEEVVVVECLPPDDAAILALLTPHFRKVELLPFSVMWRQGFPALPRTRWLTTRYHPHLIGEANGAWGVVLPVGGDHTMGNPQDLIDAGSGWAIAPDLDTVIPWSRHIRQPYSGRLPQLVAAKLEVADRVGRLLDK